MALSLLAASSARVDYGDVSGVESSNKLSIAVTVKITNAPATSDRLIGKWRGGLTTQQSLLLFIDDTNELAFIISPGGGTANHYGKKTTVTNLAAGNVYRILAKLDPLGNAGAIWVNGVSQTITARGTNASASTANITDPLFVGYEAASGTDCLDAEYSEAAIWAGFVNDWFCEAYGKGYSPIHYPFNRVWYAPLMNTSHLGDQWGGAAGTNTGGTNAAHQPMIYKGGAR